jgi:hypothetical protein
MTNETSVLFSSKYKRQYKFYFSNKIYDNFDKVNLHRLPAKIFPASDIILSKQQT